MDDIARDFIAATGIPVFAVLIGVGVWALLTLIVNAVYFITGRKD